MKLNTERMKTRTSFGCAISKQSQKHSQECYVLAILRYLYPDRYSDVVLGERPDLQGNKVGVEVTICEDSEEIMVNREFVQYCEGNNKDIRRKTIQKSGRYKIENRTNVMSVSQWFFRFLVIKISSVAAKNRYFTVVRSRGKSY